MTTIQKNISKSRSQNLFWSITRSQLKTQNKHPKTSTPSEPHYIIKQYSRLHIEAPPHYPGITRSIVIVKPLLPGKSMTQACRNTGYDTRAESLHDTGSPGVSVTAETPDYILSSRIVRNLNLLF